MAFPVLPPKYYLHHFNEFLDFLELHYKAVMEESQIQFIADFRSLSEEAQCLYVRMINRKGRFFDRSDFFKYKEVEDVEAALSELMAQRFLGLVDSSHTRDLLFYLNKNDLKKWIQVSGLKLKDPIKMIQSREQMQMFGQEKILQLDILKVPDFENRMVQKREIEVEYLLFLFFGSIQKNLGLYTLRDLGIRQSHTLKKKFKPRYSDREEARAEFFFAKQLDVFSELSSSELVCCLVQALDYTGLKSSTQSLKNELLFRIGEYFINIEEATAIKAWRASRHPEARERIVRFLFRQGKYEECRATIDEILQDPRADVELLFAEDFLARKFNKKPLSYLSEVLVNAQEIALSDAFFKRPELGVQDYYRKIGFFSQFTENHLWLSLFGVLFWNELFESDQAAIHSPFERSPADLVGLDFYETHMESIEEKLALFKNVKSIQEHLLRTVAQNYGRLNDIFLWNESLAENLLSFVALSLTKDVAHVLRTMAKNFQYHHSGFPDLIVEKDGEIRFVEVKAEGDSLRANQLSRIRLLREAGFEVDVLRVNWKFDPEQIYVAVDVETTGGSALTHRVTEVAAVKIQNGIVIDEFHTLVNPLRVIPKMITALTGITNKMVETAPTFKQIADSLFEFMEGSIFVAHNVRFDYGFIQKEFASVEKVFVRPNLCTVSGIRKVHPGLKSYSLKNLTTHFKIPLDQHHRALSDARAAGQLFLLMKGIRNEDWEKDFIRGKV